MIYFTVIILGFFKVSEIHIWNASYTNVNVFVSYSTLMSIGEKQCLKRFGGLFIISDRAHSRFRFITETKVRIHSSQK